MIPDNIQVSHNQHATSASEKHSTGKSENSGIPSRASAGLVIAEMLAQVDKTSRTTFAAQQKDDKDSILEATIMNALSKAGSSPSDITDMIAQLRANDKTLPVAVQGWLNSNYDKIDAVINQYVPKIEKYEKDIEKIKQQEEKLKRQNDGTNKGFNDFQIGQDQKQIKDDEKKMKKPKEYMQDLVSADAKRAANTGKTDGEYATATLKLLSATQKNVAQGESSSESTIKNLVSGLAINSPKGG